MGASQTPSRTLASSRTPGNPSPRRFATPCSPRSRRPGPSPTRARCSTECSRGPSSWTPSDLGCSSVPWAGEMVCPRPCGWWRWWAVGATG
uniref:Uncharacterized protein n=1 Tax=Arundo donax TaxID=35708 RepID=A0A0A9HBZ6_ARUDO